MGEGKRRRKGRGGEGRERGEGGWQHAPIGIFESRRLCNTPPERGGLGGSASPCSALDHPCCILSLPCSMLGLPHSAQCQLKLAEGNRLIIFVVDIFSTIPVDD